jgi:hypothetical protein
MYATIRRYTPKSGTVTTNDIRQLKQRLQDKFVPIVQELPGFHSYYAIDIGGAQVVTVSVFDDKHGATESTRRAAEFVKSDPLRERLGTPEVLEGEVLSTKEVMASAH